MQDWLDKLTDLSALQGDESILKQAIADFADQAGFGGYAYLYIRPGHTIAASNYHPEWRSTYFRRNFEAVDPVVKRAKSLKQGLHGVVSRSGPASPKPSGPKLEETRKRLGIHTMPHLVALAIRAGLI